MNSEKNKAGRPARDGEAAVGHIHMRTTLDRKAAYVRAAQPKPLAAWVTEELDRACGYCSKRTPNGAGRI